MSTNGEEQATTVQSQSQPVSDLIRDKAIRLFTYLKELTELRYEVNRDCENYEDVIWWAEIPKEKECYCVGWDLHKDPTFENWIRVERPKRKRPPMPGLQLREWMNERELYDASLDAPSLKETLVSTVKGEPGDKNGIGETIVKKLSDHPAITKQWELYVEHEWWPWAIEDRRLSSVQNIYNELFAVYQKQQRLGEAFEVVVGAGLLTWRPPHGPEVKRHVVVAQASVEFDESTGVISVDAAADGARPSVEQEMLEPQDRPPPGFQNTFSFDIAAVGDELWSTPKFTSLITTYFEQLSSEGTLDLSLTPQDGSLDRSRPQMNLAPALIVRRRSDRNLLRIFQEICTQLKAGGDIPLGVERVVEIRDDSVGGQSPGTENGEASGAPQDVYLPLPTNEAQRQVVQRLESRQGVLVQGPPGTGKSHTIVNLVCHLLATGKRILITSHTARALKVLKKYMTDHAPEVAPLCVSLLGDDSEAVHQLEESVQGILNRLHNWNSDRNRSQIGSLEKDIKETKEELAQAVSELRQIRTRETAQVNLSFGNYVSSPREIAERLVNEKPSFGWLAAFTPSGDPPPFDNGAAVELLELIRKFDLNTSWQTRRQIPDRESMLSLEDFNALVERERRLTSELEQADVKSVSYFSRLAVCDSIARDKLRDALRQYLWEFDQLEVIQDGWTQRAVLDASSDNHGIWQHLRDATLEKCELIEKKVAGVSELEVGGLESHELSTLAADASTLKEHLENGGSLGLMVRANPFTPKQVKAALYIASSVRVNGRPCENREALTQLLDWLHVATLLDRVEREWKEVDAPGARRTFQHRFHELKRRSEILEKILGLRSHMDSAREHGRRCGVPTVTFVQVSDVRRLSEVVEAVDVARTLENVKNNLSNQLEHFQRVRRLPDAHYIVAEGAAAVESRDVERFSRVFSEIEAARKVLLLRQRRDELLSNLGCCELLRDALVNSASDPVWAARLGAFSEAWNWCRADNWLQRFSDPGHERALLQKIDSCQQRIRVRTQELTGCKAWEFVLARLRQDEREHLSAWRLAIRKIGKGTGKYAPQHRREARLHLEHCRPAIPAWVMPVYRVAETIQPKPGMFDVAIIDEASQSGPEALFLLYVSKKIVIVGDDQQISPESVGLDRDAVNSLRDRFIKDLPHEDALGVDNSFFEQAEIRFSGRIRLREHFRCMPEIIQFSNNLCYQAEPLVPLRQYGAGRLTPVVTRYVPTGYVKGRGQRVINEPEAEAIVQQIVRCVSDPAYEKKTIGVISLQGSAQANLIRDLLMDKIGVQKMLERNIVCGDAYAFQGDERDVMFLSMVAAVGDDHRIGVLSRDADKRRFNVAASRAKDQMWLFHSVTLEDLSQLCFRRRLLEYCLNPKVSVDTLEGVTIGELRRKTAESDRASSRSPVPFDSWFEVDVFLRLADRGFRVIPQYELAGKRIDLLVEGMRGRLAVECDGDEHHGLDEWEQDVARQRMLERCGLEFWRVRASTFYRDQEQALYPLWHILEDRGIRAQGDMEKAPGTVFSSVSAAKTTVDEEDIELQGGPVGGEGTGPLFTEEESAEEEELPSDETVYSSTGASFDEISCEEYRTWQSVALPDPHTASLADVAEGFIKIVEAEGPMICRRAYSLYNRAIGGSRLGSRTVKIMNRAVYRAIRLGRVISVEGTAGEKQVVQLSGRPSVVVRKRGPRQLNEIPPSEIAAVREAVKTAHISWNEEQLVRRLAEFYGVGRLTAEMRKLLLR